MTDEETWSWSRGRVRVREKEQREAQLPKPQQKNRPFQEPMAGWTQKPKSMGEMELD